MPIFSYYKIVSKDENIKDCYVGKTRNFKRRVIQHKSDCYNENYKAYNLKVYEFIRENGGINNFNFIEIEKNEYNDKDSAIRERYWIEELNANLNSLIPSRTDKEYNENNKEIINEKHKEYRENNIEILNQKAKKKISCECCCEIRKDYLSRHLKSKKHQEYLLNEIN